ncbi:MAG: DUF2857 domain-containing protein [Candidatus Accumulibacter sp.]|jgi:hypothetical protein|nr:DUF2857 domain-containing protein [Accumulibacter sp.]
MPMPHPLNQAILIQALHDLRNGQSHRCQALGFGERELRMLKQPAQVALLMNARVPWCRVEVDQEMLERITGQAQDIKRGIRAVDRMLRLGASTEMVSRHHGLTHQEIALRRKLIGLPGRKGRPLALHGEQEAALWRAWKTAVVERGIAPDDEAALLEWAMDATESMAVSLAVVWAVLRDWIRQGLAGK